MGDVEHVGSAVTPFKVGDRAGGSRRKISYGHCERCISGRDIQRYQRATFVNADLDNGTYSQYYIGKERFIHRIPDGMSIEMPLPCNAPALRSTAP